MKKKDFELIASILQDIRKNIDSFDFDNQYDIFKDTCNIFADKLASLYPKFQKDKFLKACGVETKGQCINCCCDDCKMLGEKNCCICKKMF